MEANRTAKIRKLVNIAGKHMLEKRILAPHMDKIRRHTETSSETLLGW